jgi:hypothetical protein
MILRCAGGGLRSPCRPRLGPVLRLNLTARELSFGATYRTDGVRGVCARREGPVVPAAFRHRIDSLKTSVEKAGTVSRTWLGTRYGTGPIALAG